MNRRVGRATSDREMLEKISKKVIISIKVSKPSSLREEWLVEGHECKGPEAEISLVSSVVRTERMRDSGAG